MEQAYKSSHEVEIEDATRRPMWFHMGRSAGISGALQEALVLQREPQQRVGALALEFKLAAHAGAVVLDGSVVDRKLSADFFAGFSLRNQAHDAELSRGEIAGQGIA